MVSLNRIYNFRIKALQQFYARNEGDGTHFHVQTGTQTYFYESVRQMLHQHLASYIYQMAITFDERKYRKVDELDLWLEIRLLVVV